MHADEESDNVIRKVQPNANNTQIINAAGSTLDMVDRMQASESRQMKVRSVGVRADEKSHQGNRQAGNIVRPVALGM